MSRGFERPKRFGHVEKLIFEEFGNPQVINI
ncbi:hypothetical protein IAE37_001199 [Pseudomonas sp. S31]|nr:hypothetical protein [Pseudomonas sp. S31]